MKARFCILFLLCLGLLSCNSKVEEEFLLNDGLCLEEGGTTVFSYDPSTCQISYNPTLRQFRVMNDNMSGYYMVTCSDLPSAPGQKLTATVRWSTGTSVQTLSDIQLKVEKVEGDQIWLWSSRRRLAVSVRVIH